MQPARDDAATVEYHRGPPLPLRPTLLAPHPASPNRAQIVPLSAENQTPNSLGPPSLPHPQPAPQGPRPALPPSLPHPQPAPQGPRPGPARPYPQPAPVDPARPYPPQEVGNRSTQILAPTDLARFAPDAPVRRSLPASDPARLGPRPVPGLPPPGPALIAPRPGSPPAWGQPAPCTTCPFRQVPDRTLIIPDAAAQPEPTATQLLPHSSGSTTVLQFADPPPPRRRHVALSPPPPRRSPLVYVQLGLWLVIAVGLLILALRQVS